MTANTDTGTQLRFLYDQDGGVRAVFSAKVADYTASRPDYPAALFAALRVTCNLSFGSVVADIGAGTGLLTQGLLQAGYRVVAVEPNAEMRKAADCLLGTFPEYRSVEGCAEAMPLEASSVDLIAVAQAFHWFEIGKARAECLRVLGPQGRVALVWNDRVPGDPLHAALDALFDEFGGARRAALVAHEDRADAPEFFGEAVPLELSWPHAHTLDEAGIGSLVFSRSYMPERSSSAGVEIELRVREIFNRLASAGLLTVRYTTVAIVGRPG